MTRVHVICEGQTEEMFVNELLAPIMRHKNIVLLPSMLGIPGRKGGDVSIERVIRDVRLRLLSDRSAYCTLLIDFYGISSKFPGYREASRATQHTTKYKTLIRELAAAVQVEVGQNVIRRFLPYVQMYEFEGLLFSEPTLFASAIGAPELAEDFATIRSSFRSPEEINDSPVTAPSKRVKSIYPQFEKPIHGTFAAIEIGIERIRKECKLFSNWLSAIENCQCDNNPLES